MLWLIILGIMGAFSILTCNVNGLNNQTKRANFFEFFEKSPYDLFLLQETGSAPVTERYWKSEWKGTSIWNAGPNPSSCGVAILGKPHISMTEQFRDVHGRILNVLIKTDDDEVQVVCLYAPNVPRERRQFFEGLVGYLDVMNPLFIAGDFNMVESLSLDTSGTNQAPYHLTGTQ